MLANVFECDLGIEEGVEALDNLEELFVLLEVEGFEHDLHGAVIFEAWYVIEVHF